MRPYAHYAVRSTVTAATVLSMAMVAVPCLLGNSGVNDAGHEATTIDRITPRDVKHLDELLRQRTELSPIFYQLRNAQGTQRFIHEVRTQTAGDLTVDTRTRRWIRKRQWIVKVVVVSDTVTESDAKLSLEKNFRQFIRTLKNSRVIPAHSTRLRFQPLNILPLRNSLSPQAQPQTAFVGQFVFNLDLNFPIGAAQRTVSEQRPPTASKQHRAALVYAIRDRFPFAVERAVQHTNVELALQQCARRLQKANVATSPMLRLRRDGWTNTRHRAVAYRAQLMRHVDVVDSIFGAVEESRVARLTEFEFPSPMQIAHLRKRPNSDEIAIAETERARLIQERQTTRVRYADSHPLIRALDDEIDALDWLLEHADGNGTSENVAIVPIRLTVNGSLPAVTDLLNRLGQSRQFFVVDRIDIWQPNSRAYLSVSPKDRVRFRRRFPVEATIDITCVRLNVSLPIDERAAIGASRRTIVDPKW